MSLRFIEDMKGPDLEVNKPHFWGFGVGYWNRTITATGIYSTTHLSCKCIQQVAGVVCFFGPLVNFLSFQNKEVYGYKKLNWV